MINGAENIFIEKSGRLIQLPDHFESQKRLEDVIQRIVAMAGREVNQSSPICDTRLPDGSRVNVVLPPISLAYPVLTIRKFLQGADDDRASDQVRFDLAGDRRQPRADGQGPSTISSLAAARDPRRRPS